MNVKSILNTLIAVSVCSITYSTHASVVQITEGFENTESIFSFSSTNSVPYDSQSSLAAHTGTYSFLAGPSGCAASCFESYRVDLTSSFSEPTMLLGIGLWALESSTSGTGWGGKIKIGHDSVWDLDWWGVIGNGQPITGEWQYIYVPINEMVTSVNIQIFDITSLSRIWIDDVTFDVQTVPLPAAFWLFASGLLGLSGIAKRKSKVSKCDN